MSLEKDKSSEQVADTVDRLALSSSFNTEVERYDRYRVGYPDSLFDAIAETAELSAGSKVLEVGCGTGQATVSLAQRGYDICAIEPGENLIAVTAKKLQDYPSAALITANFEEVDLPAENFDLVLAAMSLHWVQENVRFKKPHELLKQAAHLAILYNWPLSDEAVNPFYDALDAVGLRHDIPEGSLRPIQQEQLTIRPAIDDSLFETPKFFVQRAIHRFAPGATYAGFLATLSGVSALPAESRYPFMLEVEELVDNNFGGKIDLPYASTLAIARKKGT